MLSPLVVCACCSANAAPTRLLARMHHPSPGWRCCRELLFTHKHPRLPQSALRPPLPPSRKFRTPPPPAHTLHPPFAGTVPLPDGSTQQLLSDAEAALVQRFDPSAELDTIGFFIAKFEKAAAAQ